MVSLNLFDPVVDTTFLPIAPQTGKQIYPAGLTDRAGYGIKE